MKSCRSLPFLALLALALPPWAGAAEVSWSAEVGLGQAVVPGTWAPLRVTSDRAEGPWTLTAVGVPAAGPPVLAGEFEFPGPGVYERPVFLPDGLDRLTLTRTEGGIVREEKVLPVASQAFPGHLILTDGVDAPTRRLLTGLLLPQEPIRVVPLAPSQWPVTFAAWGGASALVVRDPGPVLSPAQSRALGAWVASGGRLAVLEPQSPSLLDQVSLQGAWGWARASTTDQLAEVLALRPYGKEVRAGTDFDPPARGLPTPAGPDGPAALGLVAAWALALLALAWLRFSGLGPALAVSGLTTVALGILLWGGHLGWNQGVLVHGRQFLLPGAAGVVTSQEASTSAARLAVLDWPEASPWGLERWFRSQTNPEAALRTLEPRRVVLESFGPEAPKSSPYRIRWTGTALQWTQGGEALETAPEVFQADRPWLTRLAARTPGLSFEVGWETDPQGTTCWVRPLAEVRS